MDPQLALFIGLVCSLVYFFTAGMRKGRIDIRLSKNTDYGPGETLSGNIVVTPKKSLMASKITAQLYCVETNGNGKKSKSVRLFEKNLQVSSQLTLTPGRAQTFPFEFLLPAEVETYVLSLPPGMEKTLGVFGKGVNSLFKHSAMTATRTWHLSVYVDVEGIDISAHERIHANIPPKLKSVYDSAV